MEGIVILNKPKGITSFDVIRELRKIFSVRRIGHTGTLDPLATGVLVVCVGKATKLAQDIENDNKTYIAEFELGYKTDSYDIDGRVIAVSDRKVVSVEELKRTLNEFKGKISQVPPMYSAIKVNGKRLYELARKGIEVERDSRQVEIKNIEIIEFDGSKGKILCEVSKGTYIRSLIYDIGERLETFATMTELERIKVGKSCIEKAFTLDEISQLVKQGKTDFLISLEDYFDYEKIKIDDEKGVNLFKNGQNCKVTAVEGVYRVYDRDRFIGFGIVKKDYLKGYKYF